MAFIVHKGAKGPRPDDAIEIHKQKVCTFYSIVVNTWEKPSEVWALSHGPKLLGAAAAASGMYGNMYFRKKLRLKNFGFFSTYLPNMVVPFLIVNTAHEIYVTSEIYSNPLGCSLCKETRASAIQLTLGLVQPLLLVPFSSFMFATRHFTHRIPSPITNRGDFFRFLGKLYRPLKVPMGINAALQILFATFITHMEENQFLYLQKAIVEPEANVAGEEL